MTMANGETGTGTSRSSGGIQILLAVISLIGVLGASLFANWSRLFPKKTFEAPKSADDSLRRASPVFPSVQSSGSQNPVVSGVHGNVSITFGSPSNTHAAADLAPRFARFLGTWETTIDDIDGGQSLSSFSFDRDGGELHGTAVFDGKQADLRKVRLAGDRLQFDALATVTKGSNAGTETRHFVASVVDGKMHLTMKAESAPFGRRTVELRAHR
jgi:hypothetical protein